MREIKFRGKDMESYKWVYGNLCNACGDEHGAMCIDCFVVDPATLGQYTGLKDKNGVEIYEGDILDSHYMGRGVVCIGDFDTDFDSCLEIPEDLCGVYFKRCWALSGGKTDALSWRNVLDAKVIGNIHDAPELLK